MDPQRDMEASRRVLAMVLADAARLGATAAEAVVVQGSGLSVTVRMGEAETVEHHRDKRLTVTVFMSGRKGSASTSEFQPEGVYRTVSAACAIASHAQEDEFAGLAEPELMAKDYPDLDLYHSWSMGPEGAILRAQECEAGALASDKRIRSSEGGAVSSHTGVYVYGNSHGFVGGWASTRASISCSVLAQQNGEMHRDHWVTSSRNPQKLLEPSEVGGIAAERVLRRLGTRSLGTQHTPVVFEAGVARTLFSHFVSAISGGNLYRKSSFLVDHLGSEVFPPGVTIVEKPHLKQAMGSAPFDNDGIPTADRMLVEEGILKGYLLSAYSARRLGMRPTGNSGGVHNLVVSSGLRDLRGLLEEMGTGLLVTDLMGFGVNLVTGDYSRGARGFWIQGGEIQHPVDEITVAGNLRDMFRGLVGLGNDVDTRGNIHTGSVLIGDMTVAGR